MDRMKSLLQSYYGVAGEGGGGSAGAHDLDSPDLDVRSYAGLQLREQPFAEMLRLDDALVQETASLDADMQLLVYDNYARFVHATDTIRNMKEKIDQIDSEIDGLSAKVSTIETAAENITERMAPKRTKIEKLVRLQNLIRKLNFLFELPVRLQQCIDMGAPQQAVFYYKRAVPILQKHGEVSSFANIERESHQLMQELGKSSLERSSRAGLSYEEFNECVKVLIELNECETTEQTFSGTAGLGERFLEWHETYFENKVSAISETSENQSPTDLVDTFFNEVLNPLKDCCENYNRLFVDRKRLAIAQVATAAEAEGAQQETSPGLNGEGSEDSAAIMKALKDFAKPTIASVFSAIRTCLVSSNLQENDESQNGHYRPLLSALNVLMQRVENYKLEGIIRDGLLRDRATEIAEHATRKQVVHAYESLRESVTGHLVRLFHECSTDGSKGETTETTKTASDTKLVPIQVAKSVMESIEADISSTMSGLETLLKESGDVLSEMTAIFDNLIKFQLRFWLLWLANALECFCDPYHPYRKAGTGCGSATWAASGLKKDMLSERAKIQVDVPTTDADVPVLFPLALACLAQQLRGYVRQSPYPIAGAPELMNEIDATKDRLLVAYVISCGQALSETLRPAFVQPHTEFRTFVAEPSQVRPFAAEIIEYLAAVSKMVAKSSGEPVQQANANAQLSANNTIESNVRYSRKSSRRSGSSSNVHLDIERMFADNIKTLSTVQFTGESVALGVLKIVLKSIFELLRETTLNKFGFQQIEVDIFFLRSVLPVLLQDVSVANSMLTRIMSIASDRCLDPTPLEANTVDQLCRARRQQLQISM